MVDSHGTASRRVRAESQVRAYFRAKAENLKALASLPVCDHPGLIGGHREEIQRVYLRELLPRRLEVGRGMVYGQFHRSREADIVIWDADNYPSLPLADHSFFFAESVRAVLECKSSWSTEAFVDLLEKCESVRAIVCSNEPNLASALDYLSGQIQALQAGVPHRGMVEARHHIATAGIFLRGGQSFTADQAKTIDAIDDVWPDALLLLEPGIFVHKSYDSSGGVLDFYETGEDSLLVFTAVLLQLLADRIVQYEAPLDLLKYGLPDRGFASAARIRFPLTRPRPQREHFFGHDHETDSE